MAPPEQLDVRELPSLAASAEAGKNDSSSRVAKTQSRRKKYLVTLGVLVVLAATAVVAVAVTVPSSQQPETVHTTGVDSPGNNRKQEIASKVQGDEEHIKATMEKTKSRFEAGVKAAKAKAEDQKKKEEAEMITAMEKEAAEIKEAKDKVDHKISEVKENHGKRGDDDYKLKVAIAAKIAKANADKVKKTSTAKEKSAAKKQEQVKKTSREVDEIKKVPGMWAAELEKSIENEEKEQSDVKSTNEEVNEVRNAPAKWADELETALKIEETTAEKKVHAKSIGQTREEVKTRQAVQNTRKVVQSRPKVTKSSHKRGNGSLICETPECSMAASLLISSMDETADPCEDFYQYACGGWLADHPPPPSSGTFDDADNLLTERMKLILETPAQPEDPEPLHMINRAYDACMNTDEMDRLGLTPLWSALSSIGGWPIADDKWNPDSYTTEGSLASLVHLNFYPMLEIAIKADFFNTSRKTIYMAPGVTGMSKVELANPDNYTQQIAAYTSYIEQTAMEMRKYLGSNVSDDQIKKDAKDVVDFESKLAQLMLSSVPQNESEIIELMDVKQLQDIFDDPSPGNFDLLVYLRLIFSSSDITIEPTEPVYLLEGPEYMQGLSTLLGDTDTRVLANYFSWMWVLEIGEETTYRMRNITYDFYSVYTNGTVTQPMERWRFCVLEGNANFGYIVSRGYIDQFFPDGAKEANEQMVIDIRAAFSDLLDDNDWLTDEDRASAHDKLDHIHDYVAYPDWIMNDAELSAAYEGLVIHSEEQFDNLVRIGEYYEHWMCQTLRTETLRRFSMPPTITNAFYDPTTNSITILAGILQIPFYQHDTLAALNYAGIGMVIGHELTHGFDNQGRLFDKYGNFDPWMTQPSVDAFNKRAQCFVDQYDQYHPPEISDPSINVNGQQTLGENIADNGGIRESWLAYQKYVARNGPELKLPGLEEFDTSHLFFLSNANVWCETKTETDMLTQVLTNVHSPGRFRVIGPMSNDVTFAEVWQCPDSSDMNRGEDRCVLW